MPVQLADAKFWPGTATVKTASLAFVIDDLPAMTTAPYTVAHGRAPVSQIAAADVPPPDLALKADDNRIEATTNRFGVRLLLGEKTYDPVAAAADVPGPVMGMRLADGARFGGSRLYSTTPVAGYAARLVEKGPAFMRVECRYQYAEGTTNSMTTQLNAQGNRVYYSTSVSKKQPNDGWEILLNGLPPLAFQYMPEQVKVQPRTHAIEGWKERAIADYPTGIVSSLVPWGEWTTEFTQTEFFLAFVDEDTALKTPPGNLDDPAAGPTTIQLHDASTAPADGRKLFIQRLDAGAWVEPRSGVSCAKASVPLIRAADGSLLLRISNKSGVRQWTISENPSYRAKLIKLLAPTNTMQDGLEDFNIVKDMALDWPSTGPKHPNLFLGAADFAQAAAKNPEAIQRLMDPEAIRKDLASYPFFHTMRKSADVICRYDALIDSDLIKLEDRKLFRAQMAYLAYRLASPANWSPERGYNIGNPKMTAAHSVNQGLAASVLIDHPMAKVWSEKPITSMNAWMDAIDAAGHWPESSHYARVSESKFIFYAIAAHRAGLHDFRTDPRFKRMFTFYQRTMKPPDPMRTMPAGTKDAPKHPRVTPPYGREGNGESIGLGGVVAKAIAKLGPAYSRTLQWNFASGHFSRQTGEPMAGYDQLLTDASLPVPRGHTEAEPAFATLGDGMVIKVSGTFGTDYAFLSDTTNSAKAEHAIFIGTVASVQDRTNGLVLALGAEGSVAYNQYGIASTIPSSLRVSPSVLSVNLPPDHAGGHVLLLHHKAGSWMPLPMEPLPPTRSQPSIML